MRSQLNLASDDFNGHLPRIATQAFQGIKLFQNTNACCGQPILSIAKSEPLTATLAILGYEMNTHI